MTSNVHEKHTGSAAGQYTYRCESCHSGIAAWGGRFVVPIPELRVIAAGDTR